MRSLFAVFMLLIVVTVVLTVSPARRTSHKRKDQHTGTTLPPPKRQTSTGYQVVLQEEKKSTCYGKNTIINTGYLVNGVFHKLYSSCFNKNRMEVLYVEHELDSKKTTKRDECGRPTFKPDVFYPNVDVDDKYSQNSQLDSIGKQHISGNKYLARGHLAAMADYTGAIDQKCTFFFINAAPQWQPFNNGNWKLLEKYLRQRIIDAGYDTVVYTGTFDVLKLPDANNKLVDLYLDKNNKKIPVPLYFYKVVYDKKSKNGIAFVGLNNIYNKNAVASMFCTDRCRNNKAFDWLKWKPDDETKGYSFCCTIDDFRRTVPHLPQFVTKSLLV